MYWRETKARLGSILTRDESKAGFCNGDTSKARLGSVLILMGRGRSD